MSRIYFPRTATFLSLIKAWFESYGLAEEVVEEEEGHQGGLWFTNCSTVNSSSILNTAILSTTSRPRPPEVERVVEAATPSNKPSVPDKLQHQLR